jgi:CO/xanthine dehydrogenase FAD-binding subunit
LIRAGANSVDRIGCAPHGVSIQMKLRELCMAYFMPRTLPEALEHLSGRDAGIICGGTDFYPALGTRRPPEDILDVSGLAELRGVTRDGDGWRIGAATTWRDIVDADLPPAFDGLKAAAREVGSVQIQNAASVAGNLCNASPAADGVPPLLTLGASVALRSRAQTRIVALADFITGVRQVDLARDELVVAIHVPKQPASARGCFVKLGSRKYLVISIVMVSALVALDRIGRIETARVAVGACSPVAQRLAGLEAALRGLDADDLAKHSDIWARHLGGLSPIDDVRAPAQYRRAAAAELCRRAVTGAMRDG